MDSRPNKYAVYFQALKNYSIQQADQLLGSNFSTPFNIYIEVNDYCNLKCQYCDIWKNQTTNHLDTQQWMKILSDIAAFVQYPKINFSGGEPLLRKDIFQLLQFCIDQGMLTGIVTNGTTLGSHYKKLASLGLSNINVSIDSLDENFSEIRGKTGLHNDLMRDVKRLQEEIIKAGSSTKIILKSVLSAANLTAVDSVFSFCETEGFYGVSLQPIERNFGSSNLSVTDGLLPSLEQMTETIDRLIQQNPSKLINTQSEMEGWKRYFQYGKDIPAGVDAKRSCGVGYSNAFINAKGDLQTCWEYPEIESLRDQEFSEAWRGGHAQRILQKKCRINCTINCQRSINAVEKFKILRELVR